MPFLSKSQHRWMRATHPKMAERWAAHTKDFKSLPDRVGGKPKEGTDLMTTVSGLARAAADAALVEKLAADTRITPDLVRHLAGRAGLHPHAFVKAAYADPAGYAAFLKAASGAAPLVKTAGGLARLLGRARAVLAGGADKAVQAGRAAAGASNTLTPGSYAGSSKVVKPGSGSGLSMPKTPEVAGNMFDRAMGKGLLGGSRLGRNVQAAGLGAAGVGLGDAALSGGGAKPAPPGGAAPPGGVGDMAAQGGGAAAQTNGPAANPAAGGGKGGMSPAAKGLLAAGGVGLGAVGVGAMMRRRNRRKEATAADLAKDVMRHAIVKKAAAAFRKEAADAFVAYLDRVAARMPLEKTATVRKMQAAVAEGKPLSYAIKLAYPRLTGEQRGLLAARLVTAACRTKRAADKPFFKGKTAGRQEGVVKMKDGAVNKMKQMSGSC